MAAVSPHAFDALIDRLPPRLEPVDAPIAAGDGVIHAAVALLLRRSPKEAASVGGAEILFIKRSVREGDPWSGHIAFPGGRAEPGDRSLADVAVREVSEEVGIDIRGGGRILGRLPMVEPVSRLLPPVAVTPFLVVAPDGAAARPDQEEVEDAFWRSTRVATAGEKNDFPFDASWIASTRSSSTESFNR